MAASRAAARRLMQEQALLRTEKWINFEDDEDTNLFCWRFGLMVINADSAFGGGYLRAEMVFKDDYPYRPPAFRFLTPITHPNVYADGRVCISILHPPGDDEMSGEAAAERWTSVQGAESVLRSILLLLDHPEPSSPANVAAGKMFRFEPRAYAAEARRAVERSLRGLPQGFTMPQSLEDDGPLAAAGGAQRPVSGLLAEAQALVAAQAAAAAAAAQAPGRRGANGRVLRGIRPEDPYETDWELPDEYYSDGWVQDPDRGFWEDNEGADQEPDDEDDEESESEDVDGSETNDKLEDKADDNATAVVAAAAAGLEVDPAEEAALWEYLGFEIPECTRVVGIPW
ncbi:hypothetical protein VTJ83DRAFT_1899 [Remersonia thermophila]|uniref:UBC core domain-containing protein n=1 Tax=Remersonia thermophila TaxID=72144 RepID=A0ABR4DHU1_9PEZI